MSSVAGDTELFSLYEEELGGTRPRSGRRKRVQRRTVEQIVDNHALLADA